MKSKKLFILLASLTVIMVSVSTFAEISVNYSFIKPGLTLKRDVDEFLGTPTEIIIPDSRYRYNSDHYAVKFIDVIYTRDTSRVDYYVLYLTQGIYREDAQDLFNLNQPMRKRYNHDGGLVELYFPQGIFLNYHGTGNNSAVEKVEIVSSLFFELLADQKYNDYLENYIYGLGIAVEDISSKGIRVLEIKSNSSADLNGIQVNDVILEIEDFVFNALENLSRFKKTIKYLPRKQKLRFRVQREKSEIDLYVPLEELTDTEKIVVSLHETRESQKDVASQLLPVKRSLYGVEDLLETLGTVEGELPPGVTLKNGDFLNQLGMQYDSSKIIAESIPGLYFQKDEKVLKGKPYLDFSTIRYYDLNLLLKLSIAFVKVKQYSYAIEILSKLLEYDRRNVDAMYLIAYCYDNLDNSDMAVLYYGHVFRVSNTPDIIKSYALKRYNALKN